MSASGQVISPAGLRHRAMSTPAALYRNAIDLNRYSNSVARSALLMLTTTLSSIQLRNQRARH
jgi:hypothetical protein